MTTEKQQTASTTGCPAPAHFDLLALYPMMQAFSTQRSVHHESDQDSNPTDGGAGLRPGPHRLRGGGGDDTVSSGNVNPPADGNTSTSGNSSANGGGSGSSSNSNSGSGGATPASYVITTVAGRIAGAGTSIRLPSAVAVGPSSRLYIAEYGNQGGYGSYGGKILMLSASGIVSTVAGGGRPPNPPSNSNVCVNQVDGPCASARFIAPASLAVDAAGNIYVADSPGFGPFNPGLGINGSYSGPTDTNYAIRKIINPGTASCTVSTLADSTVSPIHIKRHDQHRDTPRPDRNP
jgi:hypothetical protein